jgi:germination protein M
MTAHGTRFSSTLGRRRPGTALLAVVGLAALLVAACASATGDLGSVATPPSTSQPSIELPSAEPTPGSPSAPIGSPAASPSPDGSGVPAVTPDPGSTPTRQPQPATKIVRAYFFLGSFVDNPGLVGVLREIPATQAVGTAAMAALLDGPNDVEMGARPALYTTIPDGTRLLGLRIEGGIATVNLSREFETGGGSASVLGRLAQVVFTLTQFPTVEGVRFELDGEPVTVFSGEGVVLDGPVDRSDYTDQLASIFVDRPAWGGAPANPMRLAGMANVFEATFHMRLLDAEGRTLAEGPVMATCGTGCWGTFEVFVPYTVSTAGWGTLEIFTLSAADGSEQGLTEYPVWLAP